ncbi:MAG TPA: glycosyltransferase family 39 protein [Candidatus Cybelea sp.]|nr:glycosyltransferase family 39 protein [Candidatus Cybelea sp.]
MKSWRDHWPALWLVLVLVLVAVVRIHLMSLPLERDEGEYAYVAQLMLEGEAPYRLVYTMKTPGIYAAYALSMAIFGQSSGGIRLGFMLANMGAIVLLYFVGRRFLDRAGAVAASAAYALLSLSPYVQGFNAHSTHFVILAALGAILVLLRAQERGGLAGFFWSGALFGIAFLMKQPGGAFAFFGGALLPRPALRDRPRDWKTHAPRLAVYAAGVAMPILLTGLILWRAGVWDKFWWWTVTYARVHATALPLAEGATRLGGFLTHLSWDGLFWALALAGLVRVLTGKGGADEKFFFLSWLFFSFAAICPTFQFTTHYFVMILPVIALLAARAITPAACWLAAQSSALVRGAQWLLFGLACAAVACSHIDTFLARGPAEAAALLYPVNNFEVYPILADYLKRQSPPTAKLAVFGSEPELLFYAHRRSVTGYIYMYDLVQDQPFRQRMDNEMISEVVQGRADYVVFVNLVFSWLPNPPEALQPFNDWMQNYINSQYEPCGVVTFLPNRYFWGPDCLRHVRSGHRFVVIYQRKASASVNALLPKSAP